MIGEELLERCRNHGIDLSAGPNDTLLLEANAEPPAALLAELAEHKPEVLKAMLAPPTGPTANWNNSTAKSLVSGVLARLRQSFREAGWPQDINARERLFALGDRIDDAWLARDPEALGEAVADFLQALEAINGHD
jgi:hypothetical protein